MAELASQPSDAGEPGRPSLRRGTARGLLAIILLVAAAIRVWSASGDLWLDEVWSLYNIDLARTATSAREWAALFFHDNTHPLNTAYMALLGPDASDLAYRSLSVVSGTAAVAVAAAIGWRRSALEGLIAAAMVALSYPMVHYSGEARGYASMLLAVLAAMYLLEAFLEAPTWGRAMGFVAASLLGLVSHLTFLVIEVGFGLWAAAVLFRRVRGVVPVLAKLTVLFGVQAVVVTAYGAVALTNFSTHGLAYSPIGDVAGAMAELTFGTDPAAQGSIAPILALALGWAVWSMRRQGDGAWIFFAFAVLVYPLGLVLADPPLSTVPRYFIGHALVALIAAARGLAVLLEGRRLARALAALALALFFIGNGLLLNKFFAAGRGEIVQALRFIAERTDGPARVAGYLDLRIGLPLTYHARRKGLADAVRFVSRDEDAGDPAPWFIDGHYGAAKPPSEILRRPGRGGLMTFKLMAVFPSWGLSGDSWAVYRRTSNRRNPSAVFSGNGTSRTQSGKSPASSRW